MSLLNYQFRSKVRVDLFLFLLIQIPYTRTIKISDDKVIRSVSMNVSNSGTIPTAREIIATEIICSGLQDTEVEIEFNFNLTIDSGHRNFTQISFKRKKLCHRGKRQYYYRD